MQQSTKFKNQSVLTPYWFLLPALLGTLFVHVIPVLWGAYVSFINLDVFTLSQGFAAPFAGLANYMQILSGSTDIGLKFMQSVWNVILYGIIVVPVGYVIGLAVALLMNQKFVGRTLVRGIILLPWITPDSVAYNVWRFLFQARIGLVNKYLLAMGLIHTPLIWLVGERSMIPVILASSWKGWPLTSLILLAGLQSIPGELYEAAKIDGASGWQQFINITMPMLAPITATQLTLGCIYNFHAFSQFYILLGRDPGAGADVPSTFILREAFTNLS